MKNLKLTLVCGLICFTWQSPVFAASTWHTAPVHSIYPYGDGTQFIITFEEDHPMCLNKNTPQYFYARVGENGVTAEGLNNMLAVALTAAAADRQVSIVFDTTTTGCFINRLSVRFDGD